MSQDQRTIRVEQVGREGEPVVVIDNFAPDPERLITEAETLSFTPMGAYYPGVRAPVTPAWFEGLNVVVVPVLRDVFGAREKAGVSRALYSLTTTPPEQLELAQRIPHFDGVEPGMIAVVHYLARGGFGGTDFYRHRSTGFETVDAERHRPYLDALREDFDRLGEPPPGYIQGDTPIFERIGGFDAVFNRALIYRSRLLHCARLSTDADLPADVRSGRLTVAAFLSAR